MCKGFVFYYRNVLFIMSRSWTFISFLFFRFPPNRDLLSISTKTFCIICIGSWTRLLFLWSGIKTCSPCCSHWIIWSYTFYQGIFYIIFPWTRRFISIFINGLSCNLCFSPIRTKFSKSWITSRAWQVPCWFTII